MTVFLAVLALDIKRIENGRWDWLCCVKQNGGDEGKNGETYTPWTKYQSNVSKKVNFSYNFHVLKILH